MTGREAEEVIGIEASKYEYTIDDALDAVGFGSFQWILLVLSAIGFCTPTDPSFNYLCIPLFLCIVSTTVELILLTLVKSALIKEWPEDSASGFHWLQSVVFAGELLGGVLWGTISDRLGRRLTFVGTAVLATCFGLATSLASSFSWFLVCRFGLGFAIGGSLAIDVVYFVEFVPSQKRGVRTTVIILFGILAYFYTAVIGKYILPSSWRWFIAAAGAPNALVLIGRLFWRWESPRFLLNQGKVEEATSVLERMSRANGRALPSGNLAATNLKTENSANSKKKDKPWWSIFADFKRVGLLLPVITMGLLFFGQTFGYYGLVIWTRDLIAAKGIQLDPCFLFLIIGLAELPGLLLTSLLIETRGRRLVTLMNFTGSAVSALLLVFVEGRTSFILVNGLIYFFIVGSWTSLYVSTPEMFPTSVRASAFTTASCCGKLAGFLSPILFQALWQRQVAPVWILAIVASSFIMAAVTTGALFVETAGKRLQDHL